MSGPELDALAAADQRLLRTVERLSDDALRAPSVLPGWSRGHVVAHLILNAEGLAGVLEGLAQGRDEPMYTSDEDRDAHIEELSSSSGGELRDRLASASGRFLEAAAHLPDGAGDRMVQRTPGKPAFPAGSIVPRRLREVEVHHADLDAGYGPQHWSRDFLERTFREIVEDRRVGPPVQLRTPEDTVTVGDGGGGDEGNGATVTGSRADVTWWLLGRGTGQGLTCDTELPTLGAWR
jgi:maleylpyruvate isomerase